MAEDRRAVRAGYVVFLRGEVGEEEILLGLRQNTGYMDDYWGLPSGHILHGELPKQGTIREAREEVGVEVSDDNLVFVVVGNRLGNNDDGDRVDYYFSCRTWQGEIENREPEKCRRLEWHRLSQLPEKIMPYLSEPLRRFQDTTLDQYLEQ